MKTTLSATHFIAAGVIATAFTVGFLSGPALAAEPQDKDFEFTFEYSAADLASSESAKQMLARLESKVRRYCDDGVRRPLADRGVVTECIDQTMSKVVERFGSATLAEAYKSRTGG